jgi:hypothetical protein
MKSPEGANVRYIFLVSKEDAIKKDKDGMNG